MAYDRVQVFGKKRESLAKKKKAKSIFRSPSGILADIVGIVALVVFVLFNVVPPEIVADPFAEFVTASETEKYILKNVDVDADIYQPVVINDNIPLFVISDSYGNSYESYSNLDYLGRCGTAEALLGKDLMPEGERESISSVTPSGWKNESYPDAAAACSWDGQYWANRCHLIAYALTGENANELNLITGTREMNLNMLVYEMQLIDYVRNSGNHVLYRVTPVFKGAESVARGVLMEAYSVEDNGQGIEFCVWVPNTQHCLTINYRNGDTNTDVTDQ